VRTRLFLILTPPLAVICVAIAAAITTLIASPSSPAIAGGACAGYQTLFFQTLPDQTLSGGNNTINYPVGQTAQPGESFDLVIDFGDGATDDLYADNTTSDNASHTYATAGTYGVSVTGTGVAMVPGPCEFPYNTTWTVIVQQSLAGAPTPPPAGEPQITIATPTTSAECQALQTEHIGPKEIAHQPGTAAWSFFFPIQVAEGDYIDVTIDYGGGETEDIYVDFKTGGGVRNTPRALPDGVHHATITGEGVRNINGQVCRYTWDEQHTVYTLGSEPTPADGSPIPSEPAAENPDRPDMVKSVPGPNDISLEPDVIATNLGLMAFTLLVIFVAAQIFNSTISENRAEIERSLDRVLQPFRSMAERAKSAVSGPGAQPSVLERFGWPVLVLALTVVIYGFTDPDFPTGSSSLIVITSVLLCVAAVTYVTEGGAAYYQRTRLGQQIGIRPFPFAIAIAAANVALARAVDFGPGVIFGFVATAVYLRPSTLTQAQQGRATVIPLAILFGLSILAWLLVVPFRSWSEDSESAVAAFFEGAAVAVFAGGIQGLFFSMIPVSFMAGEKVLKWNIAAWAALSGVAAFLFWHALLNGDESYMDALTSTVSIAAISVLVGAVVLTAVTWLYFRMRRSALPAT
jgi:hypothetical protein